MNRSTVNRIFESIRQLHSLNTKLATRARESLDRFKRLRSKLDEILDIYADYFDKTVLYVAMLFVGTVTWSASAYIDFSLSNTLWSDIIGSKSGGAVMAIARVAFAVVASAMMFDPIVPVLSRKSRRGRNPESVSEQILAKRSRAKWLYCSMGLVLASGLVYLMLVASKTRVGLEIAAGILPFDSNYQQFVPAAAVVIELITGIAFLELLCWTAGWTRRGIVQVRINRARRRYERAVSEIGNNQTGLDSDRRQLEQAGVEPPELFVSGHLREMLDELENGSGPENETTDEQSVGRLVPRHKTGAA
ncbi:MAG: hypothetical protein JSV52_07930 [Candidatus Zixiibacteriota bacterium]|nr:MAG: hypothetical protein JSV52_07930 [candidate division Zixibacteria bacterium]